jgi:hypothetical protein
MTFRTIPNLKSAWVSNLILLIFLSLSCKIWFLPVPSQFMTLYTQLFKAQIYNIMPHIHPINTSCQFDFRRKSQMLPLFFTPIPLLYFCPPSSFSWSIAVASYNPISTWQLGRLFRNTNWIMSSPYWIMAFWHIPAFALPLLLPAHCTSCALQLAH